MPLQESLALIRKLYEFYNQNDSNNLSSCENLFASNVQFHDPAVSHSKSGIQSIKQAENSNIKAFPNKKTKIESLLPAEDQIVVRWSSTGTHKGEFQGIAPTNRDFKINGISIYRISNGKIAEIWQIWDRFGLLEQIGELRLAHAHR